MYKYHIYYEGTLEIESETELDENEVIDLADDIIHGDARTRLDSNCSEYNCEITDVEECD